VAVVAEIADQRRHLHEPDHGHALPVGQNNTTSDSWPSLHP
jgi:hypothetical protein